MKYNISKLKALFEAMEEDGAERLARWVLDHKRVFVYGAGRSGLMLKAFAMRLSQAGLTVYAVGESITPAIGPGDLLVTASASGTTASVVRCAQTAKAEGADVFVITATCDTPLLEVSNASVLLDAPSKNDADSPVIMGTLFEQALLCFCDFSVETMRPDAAQMRKRHANLE